MAQVIQSKCPKCQNVLRIPSDWVGKSMRCKICKEVFQARLSAASAASAIAESAIAESAIAASARPAVVAAIKPAAAPAPRVAVPVPSRPSAQGDPFSFDDDAPLASTPIPRRRKKGGGWKVGAFIAACVLAVGAGVYFFAGEQLTSWFQKKDKNQAIAKGDKKADTEIDDDTDPPENGQKEETKKKAGTPPSKLKKQDPEKTNGKPPNNTKKGINAKKGTNPKKSAIASGRPFPRRALLINVNNYLFANPIHYGSARDERYPGSSTAVLADQMQRRPMNMPATQVFELSDGARSPQPTLKPVIENAISDFLATCREQDRIILLFAGHAVDIDKEAYLVPIEGDLKDATTLIPLKWVYDKLSRCLAWQKLLILDVCRFSPARGLELPGSGDMGEVLDAMIQNPPKGVQVWSSCAKDQKAYEFERGSIFLQSLCHAMQEGLTGIQEHSNPLPLDSLSARVLEKMKMLLASDKLEQTPRLTGKPPSGTPPYDKDEPLPVELTVRRMAPAPGQFAGDALVKNILDEINRIPPVRAARPGTDNSLQFNYLPPFPAKALDLFKEKYASFAELKQMVEANPKEYPLRVAVLKAAQALNENAKFVMEESLTNPGGPVTPAVKKGFLAKQQEPGVAIFKLEEALGELQAAAEDRDKETSKRWQANYDYAQARMLSRLVYTFEYNFVLGDVRADRLPELKAAIHNGWRIGALPEVHSAKKEAKVKGWLKDIKKSWSRILKEYPDTPWAVMAKRESMTALGLEWRASRD